MTLPRLGDSVGSIIITIVLDDVKSIDHGMVGEYSVLHRKEEFILT
jgi:hypothetical protein